ncbi:L-threonate dehydrogenase [Jannaschia sp. Os4]|uniref:L-threonate dehydrogenase n=1 Tax=Jannaschia sp. Os4 TaxID=2807617 RepID=UPI001EEE2D64|nr:L-threonate dehydrogenase [Jannaschia sp. Os4]
MDVAVIGLGSMGYGMAASLLRAGHRVWGRDVNANASARFLGEGGQPGDVPWADLDAVVLVVLTGAQTEAVLYGDDGIAPKLSNAVVLACATMSAAQARGIAARLPDGLHYLDAPISGGAAKAASGELSIMASGARAAFDAARPVLDACAATVFDLGDAPGTGSAMKSVNQLLAGVHIAAMAEAITFGISQGIDPDTFLRVIPHCAGTSWMLENRAPHVAESDYEPRSAVDIWPKDLGIVLDAARGSGFGAPLAAAAMQQFLAASGSGLGREDDAAVAKVYARNAGLRLPGDP